jgi:Acyl-coenzyme A synthetases/AMP-(fatty) acid ligases
VLIYMSMGVEVIIVMQVCVCLGFMHSVVFGGFSVKSIQECIQDIGVCVVIIVDG